MKLISIPIALLLLLASCSSAQPKAESAAGVVAPKGREVLLQRIKENYPQWQSLSATFVLKGKVDNAEILYDGIMSGSGDNLNIVLKDPVFRSPFVSMSVVNGNITQVDHLRNRRTTMPIERFKWVEVFGQVFPFSFFYPVLRGYPPEVIYDESAEYSVPKPEEERLKVKRNDWQAVVNFENAIMTSLFFKTMNDSEIVILKFSGRQNSERYFPGDILITRPNSNDYIRIKFNSVRIQ